MINVTKVTYKNENGYHQFFCIGHADYDHAGRDIVCSAISILCSALVLSITELGYDAHIENGDVRVIIDDYDTAELKAIFRTVMNGFNLLAEQYPKNLKIAQA